jgi:enamine deaminase RidA (YjgF/YER057c/UK114 family)
MNEQPPRGDTKPVQSIPDSRFPIPDGWPRGNGYSHAVSAEGRTLFISGQIGWNPITERLVDGGMAAQTRQALVNIVAVLGAGGAEPGHLVRLTWFVTGREAYLRERRAIGAAYREIIGRHFPAMSVVVVSTLLEPGAEVEIEATAVVPNAASPVASTSAERR